MNQTCCVILAAGLGKRMGGDLPKALVQTRENRSLIDHVLEALSGLNPSRTIVVTGHGRELLEQHVASSPWAKGHLTQCVVQEKQLGTGDAVRAALPALEGFQGTVVITYADHPLFTSRSLRSFVDYHDFKKATLSLISFSAPLPNHYGRIIRSTTTGGVTGVVETKDCNPEQLLLTDVNSGVYAVDSAFLKPAINALKNDNAQGEYYLTDIVAKASSEGQTVVAYPLSDAQEAAGVNNPIELSALNAVLAQRQITKLREEGVLVVDPSSLWLDPGVRITAGAHIGPNVTIKGESDIEAGVVIEGNAYITDSTIKEGTVIKFSSRIDGGIIGPRSSVGPFAHIRPGTKLGAEVRVGNFVETKNAELADGAKASHLTYLGDCMVGKETNIGAGTITCNYDGYRKFKTTIGEGVFIGSNSALVAPVTIGDGSLIAAGSTITQNVPSDALGLARSKQEIKEGWAKRRREGLKNSL